MHSFFLLNCPRYKTSNPTAYKWTALEGLTQSVFTIEGDVWSFAIVLSEICSLGNTPYIQYRSLTGDFIHYLTCGGRMEQGRDWSCPFLYSIMYVPFLPRYHDVAHTLYLFVK